jgi:hypothetical protein
MRLLKLFTQAVAALLGFAVGWYLALLLLMRLMTPPAGCELPCDGPAFVGLGLSILVGPIVGVLTALASVLLVSRVFR